MMQVGVLCASRDAEKPIEACGEEGKGVGEKRGWEVEAGGVLETRQVVRASSFQAHVLHMECTAHVGT